MVEFLRESGYRVSEAVTAAEAIDALNSKLVIDLVVTDWQPAYFLRQMARKLSSAHRELIIQDAEVTVDKAAAFLDFLLHEVGLLPIWICPFTAYDPRRRFRSSQPTRMCSTSTSAFGTRK
jgi:hypothetical protein